MANFCKYGTECECYVPGIEEFAPTDTSNAELIDDLRVLADKHYRIGEVDLDVLDRAIAALQSQPAEPVKAPGRADMTDLIKRLDNIAEVLVESKDYSQFCHTIYEAGAEIERLRAQVAAGDRFRETYRKCDADQNEETEQELLDALDAYDASKTDPQKNGE